MLGCIIGDIAGSYYECVEIYELLHSENKKRDYKKRIQILDKDVKLFDKNSSYTDDSVLTTAIAHALIDGDNEKNYELYLKKYGKSELDLGFDKYGGNRFSFYFTKWLHGDFRGNSYGNGSSTRIAPIAFYFNNIDEMHKNVVKATIPSHNSSEALRASLAVADTIYFAKRKHSKEEIKNYIEKTYYYNLNFDLEDLQKNYKFSSKCSNSVPQAIYCFLISNSFEDAIRKSISIGGDSDTIACIVGGISEAYYGIPNKIKMDVQKYIPEYMKDVLNNFYKKINEKNLNKKEMKLCKKI